MKAFYSILFYIFSAKLFGHSQENKFVRTIEAVGIPYYKISLRLGICQENILFIETKSWPIARMNRIMDIYYKSDISDVTVTSVEVKLIINDTDCSGYSSLGVGLPEFSATIFLAPNTAFIFYSLTIYTCSHRLNRIISNDESFITNLPFLYKSNKTELTK